MKPLGETRRNFLRKTALATVTMAAADLNGLAAEPDEGTPSAAKFNSKPLPPWFRRALRWGQTNINEMDPQRYDIPWWREHWKRTEVQGVIINAGGIVAYYPSKFPLHHRAAALGERDLFGELVRAAHDDGLAVLARMDSNRVHEDFYRAHPDWFTCDSGGEPYRNGALYVTCVNSSYYDDYIPAVMQEIIARAQPEGITDNNWSGLERDSICYCENCRRRFRDLTGQAIPRVKNWDDSIYRQWLQWNYHRRLEIWDQFNRVTRTAGGAQCLWLGMNGGSISYQCSRFRDFKGLCERSEIVMLDEQARSDVTGFQHNGEVGKLVHGLLGWDKLMPESMAMYQAGRPTFRLSSKPAAEARLWMLEGFSGGIQPWWHHLGAYGEDRRMYATAEPIMRWHAVNQNYLFNRSPVATVGLVWSQQNNDFYGRDNANELVEMPRVGWTNALVRARIPYLPVHADHIERDAYQLSVLILPNLAVMSDSQIDAVKRFVQRGGSLVATGDSSRCNEWGEPHSDFALADLFGSHIIGGKPASVDAKQRRILLETQHTYLRLVPELRSGSYGPHVADEPAATGVRHPVLRGFDGTDLLPFGGVLEPLRVDKRATVLATYIPPFPVFPPEEVWMREPRTQIPAVILNDIGLHGRVAFLPADLDRRFCRDNLPDHGNLLANLVRWAAGEKLPLDVEGPGFIDCHLYRQPNHLILHLVNLTNAGTWRAPVDELISVGPLNVRVRPTADIRGKQIRFLVSKRPAKSKMKDGWICFVVPALLDHEVVVLS